MKITLRWKAIVVCVVLEILALLLVAGVNYQMLTGYLDQVANERVEQLQNCLADQFSTHIDDLATGHILHSIRACQAHDSAIYFVMLDQHDQISATMGWPGALPPAGSPVINFIEAVGHLPLDTPHFVKYLHINSAKYSYLIYGGTSLFRPQTLADLTIKGLVFGAISIAMTVLLIMGATNWLGRHLKKLEVAANQILRGNYDVSIDYIGNDEIGRVGFAINLVTHTLKKEIRALRHSEESERLGAERMLKVIDAVPDFMLLSRVADGRIVYANAGVEKMSGFTYGELVGQSINDFDFGIAREQRDAWLQDLIVKGETANLETVVRHKTGTVTNVLVSASLLQIDADDHVLIICRDITDRKLVEAAVAHANRQLNYLLDAASEIAIIATDVKGIVQMFNRGAEKMLGYRARDLIGKPIPFEIHDPDELMQRSRELTDQIGRAVEPVDVLTLVPAKQGAETRNWTYVRKDGQRLAVSLTVTRVLDSHGKIVGFLGIARDITLQLQAEGALYDLNYQLERRVEERTAELAESNENLAKAMHDLQLAQAELVRSEKLTALGDIVAVVAHEINTPIGNCLTVASTLRDRSEDLGAAIESGTLKRSGLSRYIEETKTGMDILIRGLNKSSELVSNFKQVAVDQTSEQRRQFDLAKVTGEVVALMLPILRKTPYQLQVDIPDQIIMDSFPGPIEQIISNLINNSVLHAFDDDQAGLMKLQARQAGSQVHIEFSDDGRGIPSHHLSRIFDPFFTTKLGRGGTGLGLNIVHNIIRKMLGGQIEVVSEAGKGTTFVISLPLVAPILQAEKR